MKFLAVKDFPKFQHYRDRNPPWIKLYGNVLRDADFLMMPEAAQAQLVKLWLLASQLGHPLPNNPKFLAGKIGTTGKFHLKTLLEAKFLFYSEESASKDSPEMLAEDDENATASVRACAGSRERSEEEERVERSDSSSTTSAADFCNALITAANKGMSKNPLIGNALNPIPHNHGRSLEATGDWIAGGVDLGFAKSWVYASGERYKANARSRQITSLMYFRDSLPEAWGAHTAAIAAEQSETPAALPQQPKYRGKQSAADRMREQFKQMGPSND